MGSEGVPFLFDSFEVLGSACNLTLIAAEAMVGDEVPTSAPMRFVQNISSGAATLVDTPEGQSLEFRCEPNASAMRVRPLKQMATYKRPTP